MSDITKQQPTQNINNIFNAQPSDHAKNIFKSNPNTIFMRSSQQNSDDKIAFLEKRREMYLLHQKIDRDNILNRSRQLLNNFKNDKIDQNEETELQNKLKKESEPIENLFGNIEFEQPEGQNQQVQQPRKKSSQNYEQDEQKIPKSIKNKTNKKKNKSFAEILVQPEFMIDIPENLYENYYVVPRPNGQRALVYIQQGLAICRDKNGILFSKFKTQFKNGSVLDCMYQKNENKFIVVDALQTGKLEIHCEPTEFRQYWLQQEINDYQQNFDEDKNEKKFQLAPYFPCNKDKIRALYCSHYPYLKEGLLFIHKQTQYIGGLHPNYLLYKDQYCSMYPIEMAPEIQNCPEMVYSVLEIDYNPKYQQENCEQNSDNENMQIEQQKYVLQTYDKVPLNQISEKDFINNNYKIGDIMKVILRKIEIINEKQNRMEFDDNSQQDEQDMIITQDTLNEEIQINVQQLKIVGKSSNYKCFSDPLSKIIFQYRIRHDPIKFDDIFNSIEQSQNTHQNSQQQQKQNQIQPQQQFVLDNNSNQNQMIPE